jgi:Family of unknown function (DUF6516)
MSYLWIFEVGKKPKIPVPIESTLNIGHLTGKRRGAILKEEILHRGSEVVKYSLAYIIPRICGVDNGRILGYDNSHRHHHRHFKGKVSAVNFVSYTALLKRFQQEVSQLWRDEDEQENSITRGD